jgi:hypothetical protein
MQVQLEEDGTTRDTYCNESFMEVAHQVQISDARQTSATQQLAGEPCTATPQLLSLCAAAPLSTPQLLSLCAAAHLLQCPVQQ